MEENAQAVQLVATRRLATGLLLLMAVVFVVSRMLETRYHALSFVAAFAEAAMVGALADWFAVTALFRSPLGLPIPHTAIIPRNKDRIGEGLSDFLEHNFLTPEVIHEELAEIDFAGAAASWLAQPGNSKMLSRQLVGSIPLMLRVIEDDDVRQFLQRRMNDTLANVNFAHMLAEILELLAKGQHHQRFFNQLIRIADQTLQKNQPYIRWRIHEASPRWLPKAIDEKLFERLVEAVQNTLEEMKEEDSEWRMRFHLATDDLIRQLRTAPEYETRIDTVVRDVLGHPALREYLLQIWRGVRGRLEADAVAEDSKMAARLEVAVVAIGRELLSDAGVQARLNQWLRGVAGDAIVKRRETIADLVARVIRKWDAKTISRKLELHVGKDLQYIRINGTLVGGFVGLLLHVVSLAL
jgi:uncharacterized membrane-anchored protein YjiN (DUF445 family)